MSQATQLEIMDFLRDIKEKSINFFFFFPWKLFRSLENKIPEICEGIKPFPLPVCAHACMCPHTRTAPHAHACSPLCRNFHQTGERTPVGLKRRDLGAFHAQARFSLGFAYGMYVFYREIFNAYIYVVTYTCVCLYSSHCKKCRENGLSLGSGAHRRTTTPHGGRPAASVAVPPARYRRAGVCGAAAGRRRPVRGAAPGFIPYCSPQFPGALISPNIYPREKRFMRLHEGR